jgi:hypothetical protein
VTPGLGEVQEKEANLPAWPPPWLWGTKSNATEDSLFQSLGSAGTGG